MLYSISYPISEFQLRRTWIWAGEIRIARSMIHFGEANGMECDFVGGKKAIQLASVNFSEHDWIHWHDRRIVSGVRQEFSTKFNAVNSISDTNRIEWLRLMPAAPIWRNSEALNQLSLLNQFKRNEGRSIPVQRANELIVVIRSVNIERFWISASIQIDIYDS